MLPANFNSAERLEIFGYGFEIDCRDLSRSY